MTLVHIGEKLIILFDNNATVTVEPFFDSMGVPRQDLTVGVPGRDLSGSEFASMFPITTDQSVLPAAGTAQTQPASGANFSNASVEPLLSPDPLPLLGPEELPNWQVNIETVPLQEVELPENPETPSLTIVKSLTNADDAVVDTAGETIEYTITVDNTGNVDLTNVVLDDVFAGGATLVSGDTNTNNILETTETWIYTADYTVTQADLNAGADLVNVAAVDTDQTARADRRRHLHGGSEPVADDREGLTNADDAVVDTAGESIEYTITVDNTGNVDLTNVVLDDVFAGGATLVSGDTNTNNILETTETWIYTADYTVTQADLNAGADSGERGGGRHRPDRARRHDDATSTVAQNPSLTIVKSLTNADDAVVDTAGETIEYTITVDNTGNVDLTNVVLDDVFAGGATLVSGDTNTNNILETTETWIYTADYTVTQADLNAGTDLVNVAAVDTDQTARQTDDATSDGGAEPVADDREVADERRRRGRGHGG